MSRRFLRRASCLSVIATFGLSALLTAPAFAQTVTPPDAGQTLRDNRQPVTAPKPATLPSLSVPDEKDPASDPNQRLTVREIRIQGNVHIATSVLQALVADRQGKEQSLGELRAGVHRITDYYRAHGYVVARAFVPAQTIDNGTVVVQILEGTLVGGDIVNHTAVNTPVLKRILDAQKLNGKVIHSSTTDRGLLLLADLPAVGKVAGKLKPGNDVGTSDLVVTADAGKRVEGEVSVDDYGNRYTGQNRLNGQVSFNSPTGQGDRLALQGSLTDHKLLYGRAAYDLPFGGQGFRAGADLSQSSYQLGEEFANLDASGTAKTAGLFALYPLVRGLNANIWLTGNVETRALKDKIASVNTVTDKSADVLTLEAYGDGQDALWGGGYNSWSLSYVTGKLKIKTPTALATDQLGPRTNGDYGKVVLNLSRLQALTPSTSLSGSFSAQAASKNLDSSEKFVIGGIYGVRAYPQGEGAGDSGWLGQVELRHKVTKIMSVSAFYDTGEIRFNKTPYAAGKTSESLNDYGVSAAAQVGQVNARITMALHQNSDKATTAPDRNPRLWASLGYSF